MNWEAIGAIGEVVGAMGVIATLAYLATQIRDNSKMMRATTKQDMAAQTQNMTFFAFEHASVFSKVIAGSELTAEEQTQINIFARGVFRVWESYCYSRDTGLFDDVEWRGFTNSINRFMTMPAYRDSYLDMRDEFSPRLHVIIDPVLERQAS
ncbi:MAG: hypothetical protein ACU84Q_17050 [Gammaproteobacteria bacterium]